MGRPLIEWECHFDERRDYKDAADARRTGGDEAPVMTMVVRVAAHDWWGARKKAIRQAKAPSFYLSGGALKAFPTPKDRL